MFAIDQRIREAGKNSLGDGYLVAAEKGVGQGSPIAAEPPTPAEGKIIDHAGREAVVEIDLRQRPVQLLPIGERKIWRAEQRAQTIGQPIVVCMGIGVGDEGIKPVFRCCGFCSDQ